MAFDKVQVGSVQVSRLAIGGNPFSGFSHQGEKRDTEMRRYYTVARIKETLRRAEAAGINTFFGRADNHVIRTLQEYWDEGGTIQWFAQTASKCEDYIRNIKTAAANGGIRAATSTAARATTTGTATRPATSARPSTPTSS